MSLFDSCIVMFICVMETFLLFDFFDNFFEIKVNKKYVKYIFTCTCIISFLISVKGNPSINLFLMIGLLWIFVSVLFDASLKIRLGYFVLAYVVMLCCEFLYLILSEITAKMMAESGLFLIREYIWEAMFIKFLNFIVFLMLKQKSVKMRIRIADKWFLTYLFLPIATLGMMLAVFYSGIDMNGHPLIRVVMTVFFVAMILANMVLFFAFQKYTENLSESMRQQMELSYKNNEIERLSRITEMNDVYNETVHNISHSLKVIDQLAVENDTENIRNVVRQLTGNLSKKHIYEYSNHKLLNTVLSEYKEHANKKGIKFDVYVEPGSRLKHIADIDLVSMIGNLLDNAMEASVRTEYPLVKVKVFMHKNGKMCIVKIENNFDGKVNKVNDILVSRKKNEGIHGIGLKSVEKTAEKYNGCFNHYIENDKFVAVLVLSAAEK